MARSFLARVVFTSLLALCSMRLVAGQSPVYALKGKEVNLRPGITGHPDHILWKHNGNKVVEFDGREQTVYGLYEKRIDLDWVAADLNITHLRFEDGGEYVLEAYMNNKLHPSSFQLVVIDMVAKPTISCEMSNGSSSSLSGRLECAAETRRPSDMTFEWRSHGTVWPGQQLTISLGDKHDDDLYSCTVSNALSSETATFTAKDCYPDKSASALSVALIASLVTIFIILLLLILGTLICKNRHKACFAASDVEKKTPGTTEGSDKRITQDETKGLLDRAPTLPSTQRLHQEQGEQDEKPPAGYVATRRAFFENTHETKNEGFKKPQPIPITKKNAAMLPESSPNMALKDPAGEHEEESDSDQVNEETVRESDSPGIHQKRNESDDSSKEKLSSSTDKHGSETALHEHDLTWESHIREDDQKEPDIPVSTVENELDTVGYSEEKQEQHDQCLATSLQTQSPTPRQPDDRNTNAHADPDGEEDGKARQDSSESEGHSDSSTAEADKVTGNVTKMIGYYEKTHEGMITENAPESKDEGFKKFQTSPVTKKNAESEGLHDGQSAAPQDETPDQDKESDEDEEAQSPPAIVTISPTAQPCSPLTKSSPNMAPKDSAAPQDETPDQGLDKESDEDEEAQSPPAIVTISPTPQPCSPLTKSSPNMAPKDSAAPQDETPD